VVIIRLKVRELNLDLGEGKKAVQEEPKLVLQCEAGQKTSSSGWKGNDLNIDKVWKGRFLGPRGAVV